MLEHAPGLGRLYTREGGDVELARQIQPRRLTPDGSDDAEQRQNW